ncbi:MAG: hypothetical protein ACJA1N_000672 [Saprospiraceae bacterium]|jgi:hypothetical protein
MEADRALITQEHVIKQSIQKVSSDLHKQVLIYPMLESKENLAERIHENFEEIDNDLKSLEKAVYGKYFEHYDPSKFYDEQPNGFWFRVRPNYYLAPKKALFKNDRLAKVITRINESQTMILNDIDNKNFKQILIDSFLIDTKTLLQLFKHKSLMQTIALLSELQTQITIAGHEVVTQILDDMKSQIAESQLHLKGFVPMISARKSMIKKGEIFEADIFTTAIFTHDSLKYFINDEFIPMKNGVANYEFTPTSKGKKRFNIRVEYHNALYKDKKRTYRKSFEVSIADCD